MFTSNIQRLQPHHFCRTASLVQSFHKFFHLKMVSGRSLSLELDSSFVGLFTSKSTVKHDTWVVFPDLSHPSNTIRAPLLAAPDITNSLWVLQYNKYVSSYELGTIANFNALIIFPSSCAVAGSLVRSPAYHMMSWSYRTWITNLSTFLSSFLASWALLAASKGLLWLLPGERNIAGRIKD